jgi:hypothetical protein
MESTVSIIHRDGIQHSIKKRLLLIIWQIIQIKYHIVILMMELTVIKIKANNVI